MLKLTPAQLLGNKKLLDQVLSLHVVPAVVKSSQIKNGQVRCRGTSLEHAADCDEAVMHGLRCGLLWGCHGGVPPLTCGWG